MAQAAARLRATNDHRVRTDRSTSSNCTTAGGNNNPTRHSGTSTSVVFQERNLRRAGLRSSGTALSAAAPGVTEVSGIACADFGATMSESNSVAALRLELEDLVARQPMRLNPRKPESAQRVLVLTDVHADRDENMQWLKELANREDSFSNDILLLCGDVADTMPVLEDTLKTLTSIFDHVFFTPGNHDIWLRGQEVHEFGDSIQKLVAIIRLCKGLGVRLVPAEVGGMWIAPLWSWHHTSFDKEPDVETPMRGSLSRYIMDYTACKWPQSLPGASDNGCLTTAEWFDKLNDAAASRLSGRRLGQPLITFSHFLPLQQLLPEKRFLYFQCLAKAAGSDPLAKRVSSLEPNLHCFGHTHFSWDQQIDGIRYMQAPLCYPLERVRRPKTVSFDITSGGEYDDRAAMAAAAGWLPLEVCRCPPQRTRSVTQRPADPGPKMNGNGGDGALEPEQQMGDCEEGHREEDGWHLFAPRLSSPWSDYYAKAFRDPSNTELAPWVAKRLHRSRDSQQGQQQQHQDGSTSADAEQDDDR